MVMRHLPITFLLLGGCMDVGADLDCSDGRCDQPTGNGNLVSTANSNLAMYSGYQPLFDKSHSQCVAVDAQLANGAQVAVGNVSEAFELVFVSKREDLAREMGLD